MSYKKLIVQAWITQKTLDNHHKKRLQEIDRNTRQYYSQLAYASWFHSDFYEERLKKKLAIKIKLENEEYEQACIMLKSWDREVRTDIIVSFSKLKSKAFSQFQLRCRLSRANKDLKVRCIDIQQRRHYKECQGWHYYGKFNNPRLAFDPLNCRPITKETNKAQGDQEWLLRKDNLILHIWQERFNNLERASKEVVFVTRDRSYYEKKLAYWSELVRIEKDRLGIL